MNATILYLIAALSADPHVSEPPPVYTFSEELESAVEGRSVTVRGQSPNSGYEGDPFYSSPGQSAPPANSGAPILAPNGGAGTTGDPFLGGPIVTDPYAGGGMGNAYGYSFGVNGPQPYRFGWTSRFDFGYLPSEDADAPLGDFEVFEFDAELEHTKPLGAGWILSTTPQFGLRGWEGPSGTGFPGTVYRVGADFELATPANGPWSVQLGFNPAVGTDFESGLGSDAWMWDGRGILFYRHSPQWMFALGAGFWDRVNDRVIPYAGVVWTPTDRWEWRLLFPQPRVSYFLGNFWGMANWLYVRGEYHIEAYEVELATTGAQRQVELEDWRLLGGLRTEAGFVSTFIEAGWVFDRDVEIQGPPADFDVSSGFIVRGGIRF